MTWWSYYIIKQAMDRQQEEDDAYYRRQKEKKEKRKKEKEKEYFHNSHDCCDCPNFDSDQYEMVNGELKYWCKLRKDYCASYFEKETPEAVWYTGECEAMRKETERLKKEQDDMDDNCIFVVMCILVLSCIFIGLLEFFSK